jgi:putative ABC transport system permease protein
VVGVVGDVRQWGIRSPAHSEEYRAFDGTTYGTPTLVVHSTVPSLSLVPSIRHVLAQVDPDLPLDVSTMRQIIEDHTTDARFQMLMIGIFAAVALPLAAVGLYGVISYSVSRRTQEIGIRAALGAARHNLVRMVVGDGLKLASFGVVIGLAAAAMATRLMSSLLFGVRALDPATFLLTALVLTVVAVLATYIPARRAAHIDPMAALKYE